MKKECDRLKKAEDDMQKASGKDMEKLENSISKLLEEKQSDSIKITEKEVSLKGIGKLSFDSWDEAKKAIDEKNINEKEKWDEAKNKLFTPNYQTKDDEKNINDNLFKEPVVFNKIFTNQQTKISFVWIIVCLTVVLGICVFIFTRRFYKRKGELENEDNSYTYQ